MCAVDGAVATAIFFLTGWWNPFLFASSLCDLFSVVDGPWLLLGIPLLNSVVCGSRCQNLIVRAMGLVGGGKLVCVCVCVFVGTVSCVQTSGLGSMRPNTVIMGFLEDRASTSSLSPDSQKAPRATFFGSAKKSSSTRQAAHQEAQRRLMMVRGAVGNSERMSCQEYVSILRDAFNMEKNLIIARKCVVLFGELLSPPLRDLSFGIVLLICLFLSLATPAGLVCRF